MKCVCVLILFLHCALSVNHRLVCADLPLIAVTGTNLVLPCLIEPSTSAVDLKVEWFRRDMSGRLVHLYRDQKDLNTEQIPSYRGRTALFKEQLQKGNVSLLLHDVLVSDEGDYTCIVSADDWYGDYTLRVKTEAVGTDPVITLESFDHSGGFRLLCESESWWPEPELLWMGNEGTDLPAGIKETHKNGDVFNVNRRLTVHSSGPDRFYCRVQQRHHMKQTEIIVSNQIYSTWRTAVICVTVGSLVMITAIGLIGFMIWKVKQWREEDGRKVLEVQTYLEKDGSQRLHGLRLSPPQWSGVVLALLNSKAVMEEFNLQNYKASDEGLQRLLPVVTATKKAVLSSCNLTEEGCAALGSALSSDSSRLRDLDLSNNYNLRDSGVKLLSTALQNQSCKLEILRLNYCSLTKGSCAALSSALSSDSSRLRDLDLSWNKLQNSGVKLLSTALQNQNCKLEILRLERCWITEEGFGALASALRSNPSSHLTELDLIHNFAGESGNKLLSDLKKDPNCKLKTLHF